MLQGKVTLISKKYFPQANSKVELHKFKTNLININDAKQKKNIFITITTNLYHHITNTRAAMIRFILINQLEMLEI